MPIRVQTPDGIHEFPDGTTPEEIDQILGAAPSEPVSSHAAGPKKPDRTWTDTAVDALPYVGGAIGGIAGAALGPLAIGTAAIGGAGGEGWKRAINAMRGKSDVAQETPRRVLQGVAKVGAEQGVSQAVGMGIGAGLEKGGRAIYRGLLKPSKALRDSFGGGDIVETLVKEGATISDKGLDKVAGRLGASRQAALDMVEEAAPRTTLIDPSEVIGEFRPVVDTLRKRADIGQARKFAKVGERGKRLVETFGWGTGVDVGRAQVLKETAQDAASGAYRAVERGAKAQIGADGLLDKATATGLRKAIEARVPGVAAQNARTQALLGGKRALDDALERSRNNLAVGGMRDLIAIGGGAGLGALGGGGKEGAASGAITAGLLMRLLTSPRGGSAAAILMDRAGRFTPDAIRGLSALLSSHEDQ